MKKLPKALQEKWNKASETGEAIPIGDTVVCDICSADYTNSTESGGFIFGSYGYCPICSIKGLQRIKHYDEEHFIKAFCPKGKSFADFIREYRGPDSAIHVTKGLPK